jgi:hypothetical protein
VSTSATVPSLSKCPVCTREGLRPGGKRGADDVRPARAGPPAWDAGGAEAAARAQAHSRWHRRRRPGKAVSLRSPCAEHVRWRGTRRQRGTQSGGPVLAGTHQPRPAFTIEAQPGQSRPAFTIEAQPGSRAPAFTIEAQPGSRAPAFTIEAQPGSRAPAFTVEAQPGSRAPEFTVEPTRAYPHTAPDQSGSFPCTNRYPAGIAS